MNSIESVIVFVSSFVKEVEADGLVVSLADRVVVADSDRVGVGSNVKVMLGSSVGLNDVDDETSNVGS